MAPDQADNVGGGDECEEQIGRHQIERHEGPLFPLWLVVVVLRFERGIDLLRSAVDLLLVSLRCRSNPTF